METTPTTPSIPSYRMLLKESIADMMNKRPQYSLRAFSRAVGLSHGLISQVIHGRRHLSRESALKVLDRLNYSERERQYFLALMDYEKAKSDVAREDALKTIRALKVGLESAMLKLEQFEVIRDWYHYAIIELSDIEGFKMSPRSISARLQISAIEAQLALERLVNLGILEPTGEHQYKKSAPLVTTTNGSPSSHIRRFQRQMIEKAAAALDEQDLKTRTITSMTVAFNRKNLEAIRERVKKFRREISALCDEMPEKEDVYQLNIQFFSLTSAGKQPAKSETKTGGTQNAN